MGHTGYEQRLRALGLYSVERSKEGGDSVQAFKNIKVLGMIEITVQPYSISWEIKHLEGGENVCARACNHWVGKRIACRPSGEWIELASGGSGNVESTGKLTRRLESVWKGQRVNFRAE